MLTCGHSNPIDYFPLEVLPQDGSAFPRDGETLVDAFGNMKKFLFLPKGAFRTHTTVLRSDRICISINTRTGIGIHCQGQNRLFTGTKLNMIVRGTRDRHGVPIVYIQFLT